jgi:hypothetical protein
LINDILNLTKIESRPSKLKAWEYYFFVDLLGHEASAEVLELGPGVTHVKVGNRVCLHWRPGEGIQSQAPKYRRGAQVVNAGWIATYSGLAGGADMILVPEKPFDIDEICARLRHRHERGANFSIVVVAMLALPMLADAAGKVDTAPLQPFAVQSLGGQNATSRSITIIKGRQTVNEEKKFVMAYQLIAQQTGEITLPSGFKSQEKQDQTDYDKIKGRIKCHPAQMLS